LKSEVAVILVSKERLLGYYNILQSKSSRPEEGVISYLIQVWIQYFFDIILTYQYHASAHPVVIHHPEVFIMALHILETSRHCSPGVMTLVESSSI